MYTSLMPNKPRPENPARPIRVEDDLWAAVKATAAGNEETVSEVVRRALRRYVARGVKGERG